jgi:hypothetical protein
MYPPSLKRAPRLITPKIFPPSVEKEFFNRIGSEADVTKLASPRGLAGYASNVEIDFGDAVEKAYSRKAISERKSQPLVNAVHLALDLVTATPKTAADFSVTLIAQS